MEYIAIYTEVKGGRYKKMKDYYGTKKTFAEDLRRNGYHVVAVLAPEEIKKIQEDENALANNPRMGERLISYIKECMDERR